MLLIGKRIPLSPFRPMLCNGDITRQKHFSDILVNSIEWTCKVHTFRAGTQRHRFFDEIGELPLQAQTRLLRVLQNKEIERVGGIDTIPLNIRVIAATNRHLEKMVNDGEFREDLWFRLNVFPILVPPLRKEL